MNRKLKVAYQNCKMDAGRRKIEFLLTFEEWLGVWHHSGKLQNRGPHRDQFVMARFGDKGPYEVGNVKIITAEENCREHRHSAEILALLRRHNQRRASAMSRRMSGKGNPMYGKPGTMLGRRFSKEHRAAIGRSNTGKTKGMKKPWVTKSRKGVPLSAETRARMSRAQRLRQKRERA